MVLWIHTLLEYVCHSGCISTLSEENGDVYTHSICSIGLRTKKKAQDFFLHTPTYIVGQSLSENAKNPTVLTPENCQPTEKRHACQITSPGLNICHHCLEAVGKCHGHCVSISSRLFENYVKYFPQMACTLSECVSETA